jgi:uncharacterized protein (TIGR02217 family)
MFLDERFPENIKMESYGGPEFFVEIIKTLSGAESRNMIRGFPEHRYYPAKDVENPDDIAAILNLFMTVRGPWAGFLYKDWEDYATTDTHRRHGTPAPSYIGLGGDGITEFQLSKRYVYGSFGFDRPIYKPVADTVKIYFNGIEQESGWEVSQATGMIYFSSAPGAGVVITATFEFDVPVRFVNARLPMGGKAHTVFYARDLELVEIRDQFLEEEGS